MKLIKILSISFVILILINICFFNVYATNIYGFESTELSNNDVNRIWDNIEIKNVTDIASVENMYSPIVSFDVSAKGNIVLGLKDNLIMILDSDNHITECFRFITNGSFYVQWKDNNILLFLIRSSVIVEFSTYGQLVNMVKFDDNSIKNNCMLNDMSKKNTISIDDSVYQIKNPKSLFYLFSSSYSQLIKIDSQGKNVVIYDITSIQTLRLVLLYLFILLFITLVVLIIVKKCIHYKRKNNSI